MRIIGVIPARMGSTRFPGKPLAIVRGVPMLGHVYFRSRLNRRLAGIYIATCDEDVRRYAMSIGAACIMTSPCHERASDRTAEAATTIEARSGVPVDAVVMIQGDEPMVCPEMLDEALEPLIREPGVQVVNLMAEVDATAAVDANEIKVVVARNGNALYFSRHPVPWRQASSAGNVFKQVCVIPFRREFLARFAALEPTDLERAESIDMLRALEHGYAVRMARTSHATKSIDTPEDLAIVEALMREDPLIATYGGQ
jgi:3-deoxy-manno-octulosonate cytidylyltransferase (CMP-KDO synthetase)